MKKTIFTLLILAKIPCFAGTVKFSNQTTSTLYVMPLTKNTAPQVAGTLPAKGMGINIQIPVEVDDILVTTKEKMDEIMGLIKKANSGGYYHCKKEGKTSDDLKRCYSAISSALGQVSSTGERSWQYGIFLDPKHEWIAFDLLEPESGTTKVKPKIGFAKKIN